MTRGIFAAVSALVMMAAGAAEELKVEKLADDLFRVRMSRDGKWSESALNRYGIIEKFDVRETTSSLDLGVIKPDAKQVGKGFELRFPLEKDERVYGLGDSSRECIQRRGGRYDIWVANFTCYIPIPMAMTSRGWGVLVNTTYRHTFDVGKTDPDAMVVMAEEGEVDFYVFTGRDYRALLEAYTRLTGRPALLPAYAYGYTYVANQWTDMFKFTQEAYKFRELGLPCDIMGLEPGWMEYFYDETTKKAWNQGRFNFPYWATPDRHSVTWVGALERMGFKLSLWLCMNYDLFVFEEACAEGRAKPSKEKIVKNASDKVGSWLDDHIQGKFDEVKEQQFDPKQFRADLANARRDKVMRTDGMRGYDQSGEEPWFDHLKKFVDRGVRCFKLDGSAQVSEHKGRVWAGKYSDLEMHNVYPIVYAKQMTEGYSTYTDSRAMVYSAGGYAGVQRYVATWAGDTGGGKKPLVSVLNLGLTGHPNQSCDMEQFSMPGTHFGCFAPWTQHNNWDYFRQPWYCEKEDFEAFRNYISLRYRLFPYIYGAAAEASRTGWPFMRALVLEYPDVAEYADECGTYMFGDSLLVSTFSDTVKIPAGTWYEWRSGKAVTGPATLPVEVTRDWGGALYVKAGAIIPMWPQKQHLEKGWNEEVIFEVWPSAKGSFTLHEDDGVSLAYREGRFARTELTVEPMTNGLARFTVGRRTGAFDGMPATRRMKVRFHLASRIVERDLGDVGEAGATVMCPKDIEDPVCADVPANEPGWKGKTVLVLGDSITDPNLRDRWKNYWAYLPELLGVKPLVYGRNGDQWRGILRQAKTAKAELGDAPDAILIFAGTNDFALDVPMGEWYDVAETEVNRWGKLVRLPRRSINRDQKTFRGCVNAVLEYLRNEFPDAQVVVMTPTHRDFFTCGGDNIQPDESYPNAHGLYLEDYVAAIREGARIWSAPVIDLHAEAGLCPRNENQGRLFWNAKSDRLHPSSEGHRRLALLIAAKLRTLPATFKTGK